MTFYWHYSYKKGLLKNTAALPLDATPGANPHGKQG